MKDSRFNIVMRMMVVALMFAMCSPVMAASQKVAAKAKADLVDTAVKAGSFKTLVAAVKAADLVKTLKGAGPFTVFAPTDKAFAALPKGTLEKLLKPENKGMLTQILMYHVVPGKVTAAKVVKLKNAKTANGQQVDIKVSKGTVKVDQAKVTAADIHCSNGVIHVIDRVILPSSYDIVATASKAGSFKTLIAAVKAAGLEKTLRGKGPFTVFAPTDAAFAKLPAGTVESLLKPENKAQLIAVLKYHVVPSRVFSGDALKAGSAKTAQGSAIRVKPTKKSVYINQAQLLKADIDAANGVIHVIDAVLLPPKPQSKASCEEEK